MKTIAHTLHELTTLLNTLPQDTPVSFAGESGLAVLLQTDSNGNPMISIDSIEFELES